jgi:hypothetical protein
MIGESKADGRAEMGLCQAAKSCFPGRGDSSVRETWKA